LDPELTAPLLAKGSLLSDLGEYKAAEAVYNQAKTIAPRFSLPPFHLGNLYFKQQRYLEALKAYEEANELDYDMPHIYLGLGCANYELGELEKARYYFEEALVLDAEYEAAKKNLIIVNKDIAQTQ
jgi:tetratricopeptide (TPR) repeat protein